MTVEIKKKTKKPRTLFWLSYCQLCIFLYFQICLNWIDFNDPESGISYYLVGVGTKPGLTDVVRLTEISVQQISVCLDVSGTVMLEHGQSYFGVVWAFNAAINQKNNSAISSGGE